MHFLMSFNESEEDFVEFEPTKLEDIYSLCSDYDMDYMLYVMLHAGYISILKDRIIIPNPFLKSFLVKKIFKQ